MANSYDSQKGVKISHQNVISNIIQIGTFEKPTRALRKEPTQVALGLLPLSHIYGLVVIAQASTWRGDEVIILPKFELEPYLNSISKYKIQTLYLVSFNVVDSGRCSLFKKGPSNYHSDDQEPTSMLQIRFELCGVYLYRRCTIRW